MPQLCNKLLPAREAAHFELHLHSLFSPVITCRILDYVGLAKRREGSREDDIPSEKEPRE
jgi:hypothetical protein